MIKSNAVDSTCAVHFYTVVDTSRARNATVSIHYNCAVNNALKIEKIFFSPKVPIQLWRLKFDSTAAPGAICAQFRSKKLNQKAIPAHAGAYFQSVLETESTLGNWTVLALI